MFSQQENHIPGTDARRRVCAYCCQEGDSSVKKITERALIGILAAFVEAQNRFRLETMGYAGEQVLTLAQVPLTQPVFRVVLLQKTASGPRLLSRYCM